MSLVHHKVVMTFEYSSMEDVQPFQAVQHALNCAKEDPEGIDCIVVVVNTDSDEIVYRITLDEAEDI